MRRTRCRKASTAKWSLVRRSPSMLLGLFLHRVGYRCGRGVVLWAKSRVGVRIMVFSCWDSCIWGCRGDRRRLVDGRGVIKALVSSSSTDNDDDDNCKNCDATNHTSDRPSYNCRNVVLGTCGSSNCVLPSITTIL